MDVGTGLALFGSAKLAERLLGPTCDYIGEGIKNLAKRRVENIATIFSIAAKKLGEEKLNKPGAVSPRVLRDVLDVGSFCEDAVAAEYYGGILASSRSPNADDRSLPFLKIVESSSVYALRLHYLFYSELRREHLEDLQDQKRIKEKKFGGHGECLYIPSTVLESFLQPPSGTQDHITHETLTMLACNDLIDATWRLGRFLDSMTAHSDNPFYYEGVMLRPSSLGISLFLWVAGLRDHPESDYYSPGLTIDPAEGIDIPSGAVAEHTLGGM